MSFYCHLARERVIEYCLGDSGSDLLVRKTVSDFVLSVGDRTPAPGGGSVSALLTALGCALAAMVSKLSYGRKQWEHLDSQMRRVIPALHAAMLQLLPLIDADTDAFNDYMVHIKHHHRQHLKVLSKHKSTSDSLNLFWLLLP